MLLPPVDDAAHKRVWAGQVAEQRPTGAIVSQHDRPDRSIGDSVTSEHGVIRGKDEANPSLQGTNRAKAADCLPPPALGAPDHKLLCVAVADGEVQDALAVESQAAAIVRT